MMSSELWVNEIGLISNAGCIQRTISATSKFAQCDVPILIFGETGVGKELFARAAHYISKRSGRPFVPVNCGGLPENLVENELFGHAKGAYTDARSGQRGLVALAEGGTLFLDEVDALSGRSQVALLRFLQDRQFRQIGSETLQTADVRIVAATNADLNDLVARGLFRQDLLFRLDVATLRVPALRERGDDVVILAKHFLHRFSLQHGRPKYRISEKGQQALRSYSWPGNVRELENVVHRTVLLTESDTIDAFAIGPELDCCPNDQSSGQESEHAAHLDFKDGLKRAKARYVARFERDYLRWLLIQNRGNISAAARAAGTERRYLGRLIKRAGLSVSAFRGEPS